jgi:hypothetical protein
VEEGSVYRACTSQAGTDSLLAKHRADVAGGWRGLGRVGELCLVVVVVVVVYLTRVEQYDLT